MSSLLLFVFLTSSVSCYYANAENCTAQRCKEGGPVIRYPFTLRGRQPESCGYPGFEVYCSETSDLMIDLPFSVSFTVMKIDYKSQKIHLFDPKRCLPRTLQPLNLSSSPFSFYGIYGADLVDYVLFNISDPYNAEAISGEIVHCLSDSRHQLYFGTLNAFSQLCFQRLCVVFHTFRSLPDNHVYGNVIHLSWSKPSCGSNCEAHGRRCMASHNSTTGYQCVKNHTGEKLRIAGVVIGSYLVATTIAALIIFLWVKRMKEMASQKNIEGFLADYRALKPSRFGYSDIKKITKGFSEKLGEGGYGTVYKGKLSNELNVAVKVLNHSNEKGEEFVNEVSTLGRINHVNVVRLVGFCAEGSHRVVVYEFLPNGTLENFISHNNNNNNEYEWEKVQDIAVGVAKGIEYLHQGCDQQILHFDIKPHNILLDQQMVPKICDFGLAKLCSNAQISGGVTVSTTRGTVGYIAPEVLSRTFGGVSHKSDVYSFGVVLLEMVGARNTKPSEDDNSISSHRPPFSLEIYNHLSLGEEFRLVVEGGKGSIARKLGIVGLHCIQWYASDRPSMRDVVHMLQGDGSHLTIPPNPFTTNSNSDSGFRVNYLPPISE